MSKREHDVPPGYLGAPPAPADPHDHDRPMPIIPECVEHAQRTTPFHTHAGLTGFRTDALGRDVATTQPCSERWHEIATEGLPPDDTVCWVATRNENVFSATSSRNCAGGWTNEDTWEDFDGEVTHWMPAIVPAPPTKEPR